MGGRKDGLTQGSRQDKKGLDSRDEQKVDRKSRNTNEIILGNEMKS